MPATLSLIAFALAFAQRPGTTVYDSRIELTADVGLFLDRVKAVWSPTVDLGHVQSGQFVGYLFPMGPWQAGWEATGMPVWIGQRIWLGALLALAAWGVVRLMDHLHDPRRGAATAFAGAVYITTPYVATYVNGSSITLLAYAALPWLLVATHRGLMTPRGWRWPAVAALLIGVAGGGVNAAVLAWVVLAALALLVYEVTVLRVPSRAAGSFLWRTALCSALASAWWLGPVLVQGAQADQFLRFTEGPETIWGTPSLSESIRGLGYWLLYLAVRAEPIRSIADTYLFNPLVVAATLLLPLLAVAGLRWTRRWAYGPFFALLLAGSVLVMSIGFPEGTPMRGILTAVYYDVESLRFLRTTYKAAPLLALAVACLGGAALQVLVTRAASGELRWLRGRRLPRWAPLTAFALPVLTGLPLVTGNAIERGEAYGDIPAYWKRAVADVERSAPAGKRTMVLPGALFGWYRWGYTVNSVAPTITERPVLVREVVRYADPRASQLQAEVDDLIQQGRLVPGQLRPLLQLLGVGEVLVNSDYRPLPSGAIDSASLSAALAGQPGLSRPAEEYGETRTYVPAGGRGGGIRRLPDIGRFRTPGTRGPGVVRLHRRAGAVVLDGDAEGVGALAAVGRLDPERALFYAGDLDRERLSKIVRDGATLVFTDSNRRRVLETNQLRANRGPTVGPGDPLPRELPSYELFPERGTGAQTVALYTALEYLRAPLFRSFSLFPEHRPYAALDGRLDTSWLASEATFQPERSRWLELGFRRARRIPWIRVFPHSDRLGLTDEIAISVNGGPERDFELRRGSNRLVLGSDAVRTLRLRILGTNGPGDGPGGIAELALPGVHIRETLRLPTELPRLVSELPLAANPVLVVLRRTTADFPYRAGNEVGDAQAASQLDMVDAERGLVRDVTMPESRLFRFGGWASIDPATPDERFDELAGLEPGWRFSSSGRFEGVPGHRASSAFDGDPGTAWVGDALPGRAPWLSWHAPSERAVRVLNLSPGPPQFGFPRLVRVSGPGGLSVTRWVPRDGEVVLPRQVRTRSLRIVVLESYSPRGRIRDLRATAIGDVVVGDMRPPRPRRGGALGGHCGDLVVRAGGRTAGARLSGSIEDLDAGRPLRFSGCGSPLPLARGTTRVTAEPGPVARPDYLALSSDPPATPSPAGALPGRVLSPGDSPLGGRRDDVRLDVEERSWLVLAESYSPAWRAWCSEAGGPERALGSPTPIDGYANGWPVDRRCDQARFAFGPQRFADAAYAVSAAGALTLLLLVLLAPGKRRTTHPRRANGLLPVHDPIRRLHPRGALLAAALAGAIGSVAFALRAGVVLAPLTFGLALAGVNVRRLIAVAGLAIAAALALYLLHAPPDLAGFTFSYPIHHIAAHWAIALCVCCLSAAAVLASWGLRRSAGSDRRGRDARQVHPQRQ